MDPTIDIFNVLEILNNRLLNTGRIDNNFTYQTDGEYHFIKYGPIIILCETEALHNKYKSDTHLTDTIIETTTTYLKENIQDLENINY